MRCTVVEGALGEVFENIAEAVHYMVEGHAIAGERPKGDTLGYVIDARDTESKISA